MYACVLDLVIAVATVPLKVLHAIALGSVAWVSILDARQGLWVTVEGVNALLVEELLYFSLVGHRHYGR